MSPYAFPFLKVEPRLGTAFRYLQIARIFNVAFR
jgi:hypothetical protein